MSAIGGAEVATASRPGAMFGARPSAAATLMLAIVCALLLLTAAAFKIIEWFQLSSAASGARETMGADAAGPSVFGLLLPVAEIVIAFGILWFRRRAWLWALTSILFGSFAGYTFLLMVRGEASCGCFGSFSLAPWVMFTVDTILAFACAFVAAGPWGLAGRRGSILTVAGLGALIGASYASATTDAPVDSTIDPVAQLLELDVMSGATSRERDSATYFVYVYREQCPICQQHYPSMNEFARLTERDAAMRALLLEVQDLQAMGEEEGVELPAYAWIETPTTVIVRGGRVLERFGMRNTPEPAEVYRRYTGRDYATLVASAPRPEPGRRAREGAPAVDREGVVTRLRAVRGSGGPRFAEIFDDAPGGTRHLLYAHTNCGTCIEYRREMAELQDAGLLGDDLRLHFAAAELLVDDGIPLSMWGGAHAALLFDGGELQRWYGDGEVSGDLPVDILYE